MILLTYKATKIKKKICFKQYGLQVFCLLFPGCADLSLQWLHPHPTQHNNKHCRHTVQKLSMLNGIASGSSASCSPAALFISTCSVFTRAPPTLTTNTKYIHYIHTLSRLNGIASGSSASCSPAALFTSACRDLTRDPVICHRRISLIRSRIFFIATATITDFLPLGCLDVDSWIIAIEYVKLHFFICWITFHFEEFQRAAIGEKGLFPKTKTKVQSPVKCFVNNVQI